MVIFNFLFYISRASNLEIKDVKFYLRKRYLVTAFVFLSWVVMFLMRMNLSICIVEMTSNKTINVGNKTVIVVSNLFSFFFCKVKVHLLQFISFQYKIVLMTNWKRKRFTDRMRNTICHQEKKDWFWVCSIGDICSHQWDLWLLIESELSKHLALVSHSLHYSLLLHHYYWVGILWYMRLHVFLKAYLK